MKTLLQIDQDTKNMITFFLKRKLCSNLIFDLKNITCYCVGLILVFVGVGYGSLPPRVLLFVTLSWVLEDILTPNEHHHSDSHIIGFCGVCSVLKGGRGVRSG